MSLRNNLFVLEKVHSTPISRVNDTLWIKIYTYMSVKHYSVKIAPHIHSRSEYTLMFTVSPTPVRSVLVFPLKSVSHSHTKSDKPLILRTSQTLAPWVSCTPTSRGLHTPTSRVKDFVIMSVLISHLNSALNSNFGSELHLRPIDSFVKVSAKRRRCLRSCIQSNPLPVIACGRSLVKLCDF